MSMGEIAEMMLDGTLDCETGEYLGEGEGFPRCARDMRDGVDPFYGHYPNQKRGLRTHKCPKCGKKCRGQNGVDMHIIAKHTKAKAD